MRTSKSILKALILLSFTVSMSAQTTYYVSSSDGDDDNNGTTMSTPWKTLTKVSRTTFAPGDIILFKRGDIFSGEISKQGEGFIGTKENPITFATYGTGDKPIFYGDFTGSIWTKRQGYDSIWQTWAGVTSASFGYEDSLGIMRLMKHNKEETKFFLSKPDSLDKYLKGFKASSYGPGSWCEGWDTIYVKTWNGQYPNVKILRMNTWSGKYIILKDIEFRNWWTALYPYPMNNCILQNLSFWDSRYISLFLTNGSCDNLVENCVVNRGGYTGMYSRYSHRNIFRYDTVRNIQDTILGTYASIEQAGFGAERDTGSVWEYCRIEACESGAFDSHYCFNDTIRYSSVANCPTGIFLNGVGWVAHDNLFITMDNKSSSAFVVNIGYAYSGKTYLTIGGQTHLYNNTIIARGSGLWASSCEDGSSILFENNKVTGTLSNTNLGRYETINITSVNNTFYGLGRWLTGTWPNQTAYSTLAELQTVTDYEQGSVWIAGPDAPTGTFTVEPDTLPANGGNVTLTWTSQNATIASISPTIGILESLNGSIVVAITKPTAFVLTLNNETTHLSTTYNVYVYIPSPSKHTLNQNFPNPFNGSTTIEIIMPDDGYISLKVYDTLGREITTITEGIYTRGSHRINWNADNIASGVYFYTLKSGTYTETRQMTILR